MKKTIRKEGKTIENCSISESEEWIVVGKEKQKEEFWIKIKGKDRKGKKSDDEIKFMLKDLKKNETTMRRNEYLERKLEKTKNILCLFLHYFKTKIYISSDIP